MAHAIGAVIRGEVEADRDQLVDVLVGLLGTNTRDLGLVQPIRR